MFKFGFSDTEQKSESTEEKREWRKSEEVVYVENSYTKDVIQKENVNSVSLSNLVVKYLKYNCILELLNDHQDLEESSIFKAEQNHSDLLPALYEGWIIF